MQPPWPKMPSSWAGVSEKMGDSGTVILGSGVQCGLVSVTGHPQEVWFEEIKVWEMGLDCLRECRDTTATSRGQESSSHSEGSDSGHGDGVK
eukprot:379139-Ditylum_brightwellii.AAC.1